MSNLFLPAKRLLLCLFSHLTSLTPLHSSNAASASTLGDTQHWGGGGKQGKTNRYYGSSDLFPRRNIIQSHSHFSHLLLIFHSSANAVFTALSSLPLQLRTALFISAVPQHTKYHCTVAGRVIISTFTLNVQHRTLQTPRTILQEQEIFGNTNTGNRFSL